MRVWSLFTPRNLSSSALAAITGSALIFAGPAAMAELREGGSVPARSLDYQATVDANQIDMFVTNFGSFAHDIPSGAAGLTYPAGTTRKAVYASGLWLGARVAGAPRVTVAEYSEEYAPGPILSPTEWADPYDPSYRVYKIAPGDTPQSNPDYAGWPIGDGAPVDVQGHPRHLGAQTLFSIYNDLDPSRHTNNAGNSAPLGVEVQNTVFAQVWRGAARTTVFLEWRIINKGSDLLEDAYVTVWSDPDLGGANDDLVGCDPAMSLGYCYNATDADVIYGASCPAVGFQLVQGPIVPSPGDNAYVSGRTVADHRNLSMTSFVKYINGTDPASPQASYNFMQGLNADGTPIIDPVTGQLTTYMVSGDPVAGHGWLDSSPSDRRMAISAGPFTMAPGDTQTVAAAVVIGQGLNRLASVTALRRHAEVVPGLFRTAFDGGLGACCLASGECVMMTPAACGTGDFFPEQPCVPDPCALPVGACCFDNGTCLLLSPNDCTGRYQGDGSTCSPGLCAEYGPESACCLGMGGCELLSEFDCAHQGGTYLPDTTCDLLPPGHAPGWMHDDFGRLMIDEIAGPAGSPVPPDGSGGPGDNVWHSRNSTWEWFISAGGGAGDEARFTRGGADLVNLTSSDLILRWDHRPDNIGWWSFDNGEVGPIPFGLYEQDPISGEETRLIPMLSSDGGTAGIFDLAAGTPDPFSGWPATDWIYARRLDPSIATYEQFVLDAQDGQIDVDPTTDELFARMVFASELSTLPAPGTVIRFSTLDSAVRAWPGFDRAVPLIWPETEGAACLEVPQYQIYRNSELVGTTERTDFVDMVGQPAGRVCVYEIHTYNPFTSETSAPSVRTAVVPGTTGFSARSGQAGLSTTVPRLNGILETREWARAIPVDATFDGIPSTISLMNDERYLYIALEDGISADDFRIYVDANANGVFDLDALEGVISLVHGVRHFTRLQGSYPEIQVVEEINNPKWLNGAANGATAEIRLALFAGPLADRPASGAVPFFFHSAAGAAVFPPGPPVILARAPGLFARVQLANSPAPGSPLIRLLPPPDLAANQDATIEVELTSDANVASVECLYRRAGAASRTKLAAGSERLGSTSRPMVPSETGIYSVAIPAIDFGSDGLVYRIRVTDLDGGIVESEEVRVAPPAAAFAAPAAFPNPVRSSTTITYGAPHPQRVSLGVFSVSGLLVRRLANEVRLEAGRHSLVWDGRDDAGRLAPSGVYYLRAQGETFRADRTVTILR